MTKERLKEVLKKVWMRDWSADEGFEEIWGEPFDQQTQRITPQSTTQGEGGDEKCAAPVMTQGQVSNHLAPSIQQPSNAAPGTFQPEPERQEWECLNCGKRNPQESKSCINCGELTTIGQCKMCGGSGYLRHKNGISSCPECTRRPLQQPQGCPFKVGDEIYHVRNVPKNRETVDHYNQDGDIVCKSGWLILKNQIHFWQLVQPAETVPLEAKDVPIGSALRFSDYDPNCYDLITNVINVGVFCGNEYYSFQTLLDKCWLINRNDGRGFVPASKQKGQ